MECVWGHTLGKVLLGPGHLHEHRVGRSDGEGEEVGQRVHNVILGGRPHGINDLTARNHTLKSVSPHT